MFESENHRETDIRDFVRDQTGAVTIWMVFWMVLFMILGGVAVDGSKAWRMKTMLQAAADAAAYAGAIALIEQDGMEPAPLDMAGLSLDVDGVVDGSADLQPLIDTLDGVDPDDPIPDPGDRGAKAIKAALEYAERNLPKHMLGKVLRKRDVELGVWVAATRSFVPVATQPNAIRVTLRRAVENNNPEPTSFLRLTGFDWWDIEVESIARAFRTPRADCGDPILTARTRVDVQATNIFVGICVHADVTVAGDTSADWLSGAVAALADELVLATINPFVNGGAGGGLSALLGLDADSEGDALDLAALWTGQIDADATLGSLAADAVASADATIHRDALDFASLIAGLTYHVTCNDNQVVSVPREVPIRGVTVLSDCPIRVQQDARISNSVFISNIAHLRQVSVDVTPPTGVALSASDDCLPGDGVKILIFTDIASSAKLKLFDPEVYPLGNLLVSAANSGPDADAPIDAGASLDLAGDLLLGAVIEELLGVCLGAEYLLEADAYAFAA